MLRSMTSAGVCVMCCGVAGAGTAFSNLATRQPSVHTLVETGQASGFELGNTITLAGFERAATRMDVAVRIGNSGVAQFDGRVRFYANDGPSGEPGTLLWASELRHFVIDSGADLVYSFPLPNVVVPDTFTWTMQITSRSGGNQSILGLPHYGPPTVGAIASGFWSGGPGAWTAGFGVHPFGARLISAPACSPDFNHDGDASTDADIEAFFMCLAGNCCATCDSADYNNDGDAGTDADIESFFRVLAGGAC
jgi:hypothetical protein